MHTYPFTLVTIIAEPVLEQRITQELRRLGATVFTVVEGRGHDSRSPHATDTTGLNVRIETIVTPEVAERIVGHVATHYFNDYDVIAYLSDVAVVRGNKFRPASS